MRANSEVQRRRPPSLEIDPASLSVYPALMLESFAIGGFEVKPPLSLAPMSGVTDSPFRRMVLRASGDAVGSVTTEFISVELLTRGTMDSALRMSFHPSERPVVVQIFGGDAGKMAQAARIVADAGADAVDINAGCPAPKVVKKGGGAGLLRDLDVLARVVDAVVEAVEIPVGVKIRNGWCEESVNALETLQVVQDGGASFIAVHGRTRTQLYRGEADWDIVGAMKRQSRIPVIGSGDVQTVGDVRRRFTETACDGLMVGRAAITNPWIFRQIAEAYRGDPIFAPTWADRLALLGDYLQMLEEAHHPKVVPGRMKMMLSRLLKALPEVQAVRLACLKADRPAEMMDTLWRHCRDRGLVDVTGQA